MDNALYGIVVYCTVLHCTALSCTEIDCNFFTGLHCTLLYYTVFVLRHKRRLYFTVYTKLIQNTKKYIKKLKHLVLASPGSQYWKSWFAILPSQRTLYVPLLPRASIQSNTGPYRPSRELSTVNYHCIKKDVVWNKFKLELIYVLPRFPYETPFLVSFSYRNLFNARRHCCRKLS